MWCSIHNVASAITAHREYFLFYFICSKESKMCYGETAGRSGITTTTLPTSDQERKSFCLSDDDALQVTTAPLAHKSDHK